MPYIAIFGVTYLVVAIVVFVTLAKKLRKLEPTC